MDFICNPGLPDRKVKLFLADKRANINSYNTVQSYVHSNILDGINSHPDMTFCHLKDNICVCAEESYSYYDNQLSKYGFNIIKGENRISKKYPEDIAYNVVILNKMIFHNLKYTEKKIISFCKENNYKMINVKQGYTKCSTLIVDETSVITSDIALHKIYNDNNISSLYVSNEGIKINGFDIGFIGGCGGKISNDEMGFFGDITKISDFEKINNFLKERNIKIKIIKEGDLFDYGSLIPLLHI